MLRKKSFLSKSLFNFSQTTTTISNSHDCIHNLTNRKVLKIWQYLSVIVGEFGLVKHLNTYRSRYGQPLYDPKLIDDWNGRFKKMGSNVSTMRMVSFKHIMQMVSCVWRHSLSSKASSLTIIIVAKNVQLLRVCTVLHYIRNKQGM